MANPRAHGANALAMNLSAAASNQLDPRLMRYFSDVREVAAQSLSEATKLRLVRELATQLVREPLVIPRAFRCAPARGYGRNLLHLDRDQHFVVIAMIWPPHSGSAAHDHGTWGVVAVAEGEVDVTNFEREDDGRDPSRARLRAACTLRATPGAVATVLPPHEDFHSVFNPSDSRTAVTIHTYGREPFDFQRVELASGAVTLGRLAYDNLR